MTKSHLVVAMVGGALVAALAVLTAPAQGPSRPLTGAQMAAHRIAMVDVGYIFKNHSGFKASKATLEAEMKQASDRLKQEEETIRGMLQELQKMQPGTEAYKQMEEQITKRRADLQVQFQLQNKEFTLKEANLYHTVFQEIEKEVGYVAQQNGFVAVIRFNGDPVEQGEPSQILRNVNKQVVWFDPTLDVTPLVLQRLNLKYGPPQTATPAQPGTRPRQGVPAPVYPR